ncbi:MAG TPA: leucine--tRNA ligase [Candidatus Paceibacterota bacterium]
MKKPSSPKGASASRPAYDPSQIEKKWQKVWSKKKLYTSKDTGAAARKQKYYVLDMFPYPSGEGLHVGHPKGYIATDVISRMKRMQGMNVLHPMGFDAFGLPAENYAIKMKTHPEVQVTKNVARYKEQLELLGFDYDWSREVNTTDPAYYKWTQWIFLQLWKKGLAYESFEPINWCPSCKTGLANEDLDDGRCERCGTPVEKKPLRQWVLKITDYADKLLTDLDVKVLANGDYVGVHPNGDQMIMHMTTEVPGKIRPDKPFVPRDAVAAFVQHWSEDKFLLLKWKKVPWTTPITGGIEKGQTAEDAVRAEIHEETGYKNIEIVKKAPNQIHSTFFHPPKDENRVGHFSNFLVKLKDGAQDKIDGAELAVHEPLWVPRAQVREMLSAQGQKMAWDMLTGEQNVFTAATTKPLLDWPESIKELQRNWIGRSEGAEIEFDLTLTKRKPKMVILHGFEGSAKTNFIPWLKKEFEKQGHEVQAPELPNSFSPSEDEQVEYVLKNCSIDENTVIIGHSLGAIVAMKVMMKLNKPISGLLLVAPALDPKFKTGNDLRKYVKNFSWNLDYERINRLADNGKIAILSDTQEPKRAPYLKFLSTQLKAGLIEVKANEEHFCATEEPAILKCCTPSVKVFTTRPDTIFGVTYIVLAPEHMWIGEFMSRLENKAEVQAYVDRAKNATAIDRTDATKEKTGVELKGIKAINPATGEQVPVWVSDYVLSDYGTGAVMAVPAHDERDFAFATKYKLPIKKVLKSDADMFTGYGELINSKQFNGRQSESVMQEITKFAGGNWVAQYKLRDWVFSRQRYWGEPIPLIHCPKCGVVAVPEKQLPVKLPNVKSYEPTGTGESPLAGIDSWVNVKCPECGTKAKRETNTMPQWAGSCWYYLRYEDPKNKKAFVAPKKEQYWSPVDLYVGGAEHATRHLIYARFWHKFLYDIGAVSTIEPFKKLQSVGLIMGEDGRKMGKRYGNVVNPDDVVASYGADTLRVYEMFMGPFDQQITWSTSSMVGARRFIERIWKLADKVAPATSSVESQRIIHKTIKKVSEDITEMRYNTAISSMMICTNELEKLERVSRADYEAFLKLLAPFAPHVAEELWTELGNKKSIHVSEWPRFDEKMLVENTATIILQINGKVRGSFTSPLNASKETLETMAKSLPEAQKWLNGNTVKRVIVVPDKLVNIVV